MSYTQSFLCPFNTYRQEYNQKFYKSLDETLDLIITAIQSEREDELFYDYLTTAASTDEEKDIISSIRDDEKKHNKFFREIYSFFTGKSVSSDENLDFVKPRSYLDGIKKAKFSELSAVEKYRDIRASIPMEYYRDMVFEIITDELKHAEKYDYILYINLEKKLNNTTSSNPSPSSKSSFSTDEARKIANLLGIDFSMELFDVEQFRMGLDTELEHGKRDAKTNVTNDDPILTGKIALAHLREFPDYYTRLSKLEEEAKSYWSSVKNV